MATDKAAKRDTSAWLLLAGAGFIDALIITVVKMRFNDLGAIDFSEIAHILDYVLKVIESPFATFAIFAFIFFSPVLSFVALSRLHLSQAYPVLAALHLLFVEMFSQLLLHEPVSAKKATALSCLLLSIFLVYSDSGSVPRSEQKTLKP